MKCVHTHVHDTLHDSYCIYWLLGIVEDHILEAVRPSPPSTLVRYSATTYSRVLPSSPNHHAEWPVLRSISYSLLREHGIPSSYTRLIGCDRHGHITLLQSVVCILPTHVQAVGGPSTPMGAATSVLITTTFSIPILTRLSRG